MNNNIMSDKEETTMVAEQDKIKVDKIDILVHGTADKPYYVIVYHEIGKDYSNEGFGSYYLKNVFTWKDEYFEIVKGE
nr:MAG TPA: hypothetical protein [Caudoviricetes sp.]